MPTSPTSTALELEFPTDTITPIRIQHDVDQARHPPRSSGAPGKLEFHYNFLCYQFQTPSGIIHARSYLDQIKEVCIHLEPNQRNEPLLADIERYFARRYRKVRVV